MVNTACPCIYIDIPVEKMFFSAMKIMFYFHVTFEHRIFEFEFWPRFYAFHICMRNHMCSRTKYVRETIYVYFLMIYV